MSNRGVIAQPLHDAEVLLPHKLHGNRAILLVARRTPLNSSAADPVKRSVNTKDLQDAQALSNAQVLISARMLVTSRVQNSGVRASPLYQL